MGFLKDDELLLFYLWIVHIIEKILLVILLNAIKVYIMRSDIMEIRESAEIFVDNATAIGIIRLSYAGV